VIRTALAYANATLATFLYAARVFAAATLDRPSIELSRLSRDWCQALLWGSRCTVRAHHLDRIDWSRPHVLVSNHIGSFDILALAVTVPGIIRFVGKKELDRVPIFGAAWKRAGHISIDRKNRQKSIESLRRAGDLLRRDGGTVIVFPEGTRSRTGDLQPFKKGAFLLALEAGVPIIPVIVTGSDQIMSAGSSRIRSGSLDVHFGDPIPSDGFVLENVEELISFVHGRMNEMLVAVRGGVVA
jgi:1-acyl-sn-glycerol-3-phosphate acyltransferase